MSRKSIITLALLWQILLFPFYIWAQPTSLCNHPEGSVLGDFTIEVLDECNLKKIKVNDLSGGTDIRYNFVYQGQPASQLNTTLPLEEEHTYGTSFVKPTKITVLQYGNKNGKPMYACRTHILRQNNQAKVSYSVCENDSLKITIPKDDEVNTFDYYEISLDNFATYTTVSAADLPFSILKPVDLPAKLYVRGRHNNATQDCGLAIPGIYIRPIKTKPTDGFDLPFHPNINSLVLNDDEVELSFSGSLDNSTFSIFKRDFNDDYSNEPILKNTLPGTLNIPVQDINTQQCFYVQNETESCRKESSAELCTFPLLDIKPGSNEHSIVFQPYPTELNGKPNNPDGGNNLIINQEIFYPFISGVEQNTRSFTHSDGKIEYPVFDCSQKHCYRARIVLDGQNEGVKFKGNATWSNKICYDPKGKKFDLPADVLVTLTGENHPQVEVNLNERPTNTIKQYMLWHQTQNGFIKVDSMISSPLRVI